MDSLTIAILTWRNPRTLLNTLSSYRNSGLLNLASEKIIFVQENNAEEIKIAEQFGFVVYSSASNIGIQAAYNILLNKANGEFFLFLENDWLNVANEKETLNRIKSSIYILKNGIADCVRLRHKYKYGLPLHTLQFKNNELKQPSHLLDCIHWIEDPNKVYPDYLKKIIVGDEKWFKCSSKYANYTNNPCMYKTSFIKKIMNNDFFSCMDDKHRNDLIYYAKARGLSSRLVALEGGIQSWWEKQNYNVVQGIGLFEHHPLKENRITKNIKCYLFQKYKEKNVNNTKKVAFVCAHRDSDVWSSPISIMKEFECLGWGVEIFTLFDENDNYTSKNLKKLYQLISSKRYVPDIVIHMDYTGFNSFYFNKIKKLGIFSVFEAADDPRQFYVNKKKIKSFNLVLSPDYQCVRKYLSYGVNSIWWTHFADTRTQFPMESISPKPIVISTMGEGNSVFMDKLTKELPDKFINKCGLSGVEYSEFMSSGLIILQNSRDHEISRRIFEGMAIRRLVLTDRLPKSTHIDDLFEENKEIVYYDNLQDCIDKINYYTSEEGIEKAKEIANNGYNKVLKLHTQKQRVKSILDKYYKWLSE